MNTAASTVNASVALYPGQAPAPRMQWRAEDFAVAAALAAMTMLPLLEMMLRRILNTGLGPSAAIVQHLTLVVGMAGGALAARDGRLLTLASSGWLRGWALAPARWFNRTISVAVSAVLAIAGAEFVAAERSFDGVLAGIPLWVVQGVLPVGFGVIGWRLAREAATTTRGRIGALATAAALLIVCHALRSHRAEFVAPALGILVIATALGAPIFVALGGAGAVLFWGADLPVAAVSVEHYRLTVNPALPSIPLFTLAGFFLAEGGAASRLLRVVQACAGGFRGGPAIVVTLICAGFTAFTGASGVTILALAALALPLLRAANLSERNALGLLTGAASLGVLLPPCLPVILYAIIARVDMKAMFLGGLGPGVLLILLTAAWGAWAGRAAPAPARRFDRVEAWNAVRAAKWELLLPVVSLVALLGGWATPVETAALTAAGAFMITFILHRDLRLATDGPRVAAEAGLLVGGVLLILGVALGLTNYLIDAQVPDQLAAWTELHVQSRWLFLLGLNVVLILVGSVVEIYAAIVVVAPLLIPIGARLGIDPVHLGIIFLANMELGFLAPPIGLNLLLSSYRLNRPVTEVARATLPVLAVMFLGVLLITYWPPLSTFLPRLFSSSP